MLTTARPTRTAPTRATVTRHIDAPIDTVFSLLADVHSWPRWGPFTDTGTPRTPTGPASHTPSGSAGVSCTSPSAPRTPRTGSATGSPAARPAPSTPPKSPCPQPTTAAPTSTGAPPRPDTCPAPARRRTAALEAAVAGLAAQLASAAEDPATTRAEWAHARHDGATAPLRSPAAVTAGDAVAA